MSFSGRFVPEEFGGRRLGPFAAFMARIVMAGVTAAAVVGIGSVGMLFTTGPEWASLLFEPISLLLLPGLLVGIIVSGPHDLDPHVVLQGTIILYFLFFWSVLEWRAWRQRRRHPAPPWLVDAQSGRLISVMELSGCGTALVTPFRADGAIDESALYAQVNAQIEAGIELLVACGTTGEAATLTDSEWLQVIEVTIAAAAGRATVFAGCTHNSTASAIKRVERLNRVHGLGGVLTANPYYNRPGQQGQYEHFRAIAEASEVPVMLYNIPGRTGANLEPATVLRLADMPKIVGLKESSGNLIQITEVLTQVPRSFKVFCGDDALALPVLALGGAGLISVASNVIPRQMAEMVGAALKNDWPSARRINRTYFRLMQAHFWEPSPAPVKAVMAILGTGSEAMRLPMVPVATGTRRKLEALCGELGLMVYSEAGKVDNLRMF